MTGWKMAGWNMAAATAEGCGCHRAHSYHSRMCSTSINHIRRVHATYTSASASHSGRKVAGKQNILAAWAKSFGGSLLCCQMKYSLPP